MLAFKSKKKKKKRKKTSLISKIRLISKFLTSQPGVTKQLQYTN